jgi:hypothetical protein
MMLYNPDQTNQPKKTELTDPSTTPETPLETTILATRQPKSGSNPATNPK